MPEFLARYEFKYLIRPEQMGAIRDIVQAYCEPDAYGEKGVYEVNSLYLDDWKWTTAQMTLGGTRNRFKARIRTYGWEKDDPVFFELKDRVGTTILKQRALMSRQHAHDVCMGILPEEGAFKPIKASHQPDLDAFRNRVDLLDLRPRLWVRYVREAYGSVFGDGARLTFDSFLQVQLPDPEAPYVPDHTQWQDAPWDGDPVMVEMKFNGAFPDWMRWIVHHMQLFRISGSKYVNGALRSGHLPWGSLERSERWTAF